MNERGLLVVRLFIMIMALSLGGSALALTDFDSVAGLWVALLLSVLVFMVLPWLILRFLRRVRRDSQNYDQSSPDDDQTINQQKETDRP